MILYYTATQKTKILAEALAEVTGLPVYQLKSKLENKNKFLFLLNAGYLGVTGKQYPVENMPEKIEADEIYICAPIWAGQFTGPAWYFLNHADLKGKKVNILLTSGGNDDNYRKKTREALSLVDCIPGEVYGFASSKDMESSVLVSQLREMLPDAAR